MDFKRIRYFVVLAEELHFSRAALRLNIVQPALSHQTRQLEEELGVKLFDRSSRQVALTDAGHIFLVEARGILRQVSRARDLARDAEGGLAGSLTLGFVDNALWSVLPEIVRQFRERYPQVEIDLQQMPRARQLAAVESGDLDVAIMPGPVDRPGVVARKLIEEPLHVVLPATHPLCAMGEVPIGALADEPFVSFPSAQDMRRVDEIVLGLCAEAGFVPRMVQTVQQMQTALALVGIGFGVAFVPPWMRRAWGDNVEYRKLTPYAPYALMLVRNSVRGRPIASHFEAVAFEHIQNAT